VAKYYKRGYEAEDVTVLGTIGGIRKKPSMYLSDSGNGALFGMVKEAVDNAKDEFLAKRNSYVGVVIDSEGVITVCDKGGGIPIEKKKIEETGENISTLIAIFTTLHSGGKFGGKAYEEGSAGCFIGSTKIKLLNGKSVKIEKLAKIFEEKGKKKWVYAFNKESKLPFVPRKAYGIFATRLVNQLTEVILDNGSKIICTPDHPFMLWSGKYKQAHELKKGTSLRAVHFTEDKDGYLTHSGFNKNRFRSCTNHKQRVNRTVAKALGWNIEGKEVSHKNAKKKDNRPNNLQVLNSKEHWWYDFKNHGKNKVWVEKNKRYRNISKKNMERLNKTVDDLQEQVQLGRYAQIAARAYRDYGVVNKDTYNACVPWCGPKWDKAIIAMQGERNVLRAGKAYLRQYGNDGKTNNGGLGLDYKLQSEYEKSPANNYNNHKVVSIKTFKTKKPVQVYGMSVEIDHNYLLDAGVFVKNTHGVGITVTNALSAKMDVWTFRNNKWYNVGFKKGKIATELNTDTKLPKLPIKLEQGTVIRFIPDYSVLDEGAKLSIKRVKEYCKLLSFLHAGLKVYLKTPKNEYTFYEKDGLKALLKNRLEENPEIDDLGGKPLILSKKKIDIALTWTTSHEENVASYVSGSITKEGGTHLDGLIDALRDAIKPYKGKAEFKTEDLRAGLLGILNVTVVEPKFSSQSKDKLATKETREDVYNVIKPALDEHFKNNKSLIKRIIQKAADLYKLSARQLADKKSAAALRSKEGKALLASKLANCRSRDVNKTELFLVEGDSAGGTAKLARNKEYQAVLSLRGKVINAFKADGVKLFGNNEVQDILRAVGYNPDDKVFKSKFSKIVLLTDPDVDGKHISNLILSLFQKVVPESFIQKHVYIVDAPLFNCQLGNGKKVYGSSVKDVEKKLEKLGKKQTKEGIQRIKGWGEVLPPTLRDVAFNPESRKLTRIKDLRGEDIIEFASLVGEDAEERRKILGL
jgi:DNA gyrase subunit B